MIKNLSCTFPETEIEIRGKSVEKHLFAGRKTRPSVRKIWKNESEKLVTRYPY
jgi:hypothetical protein